MSTEQLGSGNTADTVTIAQPLLVAGAVAFGGVTVAAAKVVITTVPQTSVTTDVAAIGTAVNSIIAQLQALGVVTP